MRDGLAGVRRCVCCSGSVTVSGSGRYWKRGICMAGAMGRLRTGSVGAVPGLLLLLLVLLLELVASAFVLEVCPTIGLTVGSIIPEAVLKGRPLVTTARPCVVTLDPVLPGTPTGPGEGKGGSNDGVVVNVPVDAPPPPKTPGVAVADGRFWVAVQGFSKMLVVEPAAVPQVRLVKRTLSWRIQRAMLQYFVASWSMLHTWQDQPRGFGSALGLQ